MRAGALSTTFVLKVCVVAMAADAPDWWISGRKGTLSPWAQAQVGVRTDMSLLWLAVRREGQKYFGSWLDLWKEFGYPL